MATVYSLVCWGGRTGKTVTLSIASPCVVTSTNHGLRDGTGLVLSTTGALPTGLVAGTTYYTKSTANGTFNLYDTAENAIAGGTTGRINTSGTQSGAHTAKSKKMLDYFAQYPTRWWDSTLEVQRCYDGIASWNTGRSGASPLDEEVCELGEAFTERSSAAFSTTVPAGATRIHSKINGVRSAAFHSGRVPGATQVLADGFIFNRNVTGSGTAFLTTKNNTVLDGFTVLLTGNDYTVSGISVSPTVVGNEVRNMISVGKNDGTGSAFGVQGQGSKFINNLGLLFAFGYNAANYAYGIVCANNIAVKNTYGFYNNASPMLGSYFNNIAVGNTTANWTASSTSSLDYASNNAGLTGEAWVAGTGATQLTIATTDFYDYTNNDFRPALATSPQVDSGMLFYGAVDRDIADAERPNYNNGGSEVVDVGCYEFDHGYGNHPITATLTLTGLVSGTDVVVRAAGTSTILDSVDSTSGNWTYTYSAAHNVDIDVIKPGMVIVPFRNLALTAASSSLPVSQQFDRNYS